MPFLKTSDKAIQIITYLSVLYQSQWQDGYVSPVTSPVPATNTPIFCKER